MPLSTILGLLLFTSELALSLARRASAGESATHDRATFRRLWIVITLACIAAGLAVRLVPSARFPLATTARAIAIACFATGLAIRWAAILVLGRLFTVNVAIRADHHLVSRGPYAFVRHPSYTGLLLAFAGLAVSFGSWLAIAVLMIPVAFTVAQRIAVEERALAGAFGAEWTEYSARTKRLVPGLF